MSKFMRDDRFLRFAGADKDGTAVCDDFPELLLKDGYHMLQFSVYARVCNGNDAVKKHESRLKASLPPNGSIRLLVVTVKSNTNLFKYF